MPSSSSKVERPPRRVAYGIVATLIEAELRAQLTPTEITRELERIRDAMEAAGDPALDHPAGCLCSRCRTARSAP